MRIFGTLSNGQMVHAIDLVSDDLTATVLTYGARLQDLRLAGIGYSLTEGSAELADYEGPMIYHGPVIGPVVNRLQNAALTVDGETFALEANSPGGHTLHSGIADTGQKVWDVIDQSTSHVSLGIDMADGEGGFPGKRRAIATFEIKDPTTLNLSISATTDRATPFNFANHSYWNLDGTETYDGHRLRVSADHWLPTDRHGIPTGEVRPVVDGPFDFRAGRLLRLGQFEMDHNLCLSNGQQPMREVLTLTGASGLSMTVSTTEAGLQIYDGRPRYGALAIEAQGWPDAPNHSTFPAIETLPGAPYLQSTEWSFRRS